MYTAQGMYSDLAGNSEVQTSTRVRNTTFRDDDTSVQKRRYASDMCAGACQFCSEIPPLYFKLLPKTLQSPLKDPTKHR